MKQVIFPEKVLCGWYDSHQSRYRNLSVSPKRRALRFELELPRKGTGVTFVNGVCPPQGQRFAVCVKTGDLRKTSLPYECRYLHLVLSEGELYRRLMELPSFIPLEENDAADGLFSEIEELCEDGEKELLLCSRLLELVHLLREKSLGAVEKPYATKRFLRVCDYIQTHLQKDLTLDVLSETAGFSPSHFHALFKEYAGKTLREYVEEQRLKKAISLLVSTPKTLAEIAYECGFSSQSYFNYVFKRKMGRTPRAYVKEYCRRYED